MEHNILPKKLHKRFVVNKLKIRNWKIVRWLVALVQVLFRAITGHFVAVS